MSFREATSADLGQVATWVRSRRECELWAGSRFEYPLDLDVLPAQLHLDATQSVCLFDGHDLVAFGQLAAADRERLHLMRVIVEPTARGKGFGRSLVGELLRRARDGGYARVSLKVDRGNPAAIALYESVGFRRAEPPAAGAPSAASWYMELALAAPAASPAPGDDDESRDDPDDYLRQVTVGELEHRDIVVADYDPAWPGRYAEQAATIRAALGARARRVEHIGSTAVPGLAAKPLIDVLLVVDDPANEPSYLPALEAAGYELRIREPDFYQHRMLRTPARDVHVHVFAADSPEVERHLLLRDRLRRDEADRELYAATKRRLAAQEWPTMQHYADAKTTVIEAIIARARDDQGAPG
jgi:GrpB-like predicted nucleotidyltransferase (UPF0157 family)/ribosomal protein S18 acetylase RimI-like enzyme